MNLKCKDQAMVIRSLQEGSKYAQIRSLQEIFDEFIHQRDNYADHGLKLA